MLVQRMTVRLQTLEERKVLLLLLGIAFCLRLYAVLMARGIPNDGAMYGFMARDFLKGDFAEALRPALHPLYPFLISLLSPDAASVELAGRLISLTFGTLTLIPVFYLVKDMMGRREAMLAGLFYTFHPYLLTYSGMLLTEATYWGLLTMAVYLFWTGLRGESSFRVVASGIFLALAYLTRPEGMGYLCVFLGWVALWGGFRSDWPRKMAVMAGLVVIFALFASPYLIHIHRETGQWLISKKATKDQVRLLNLARIQGRPEKFAVGAPEAKQLRPEAKPKTRRSLSRIFRSVKTFARNLPFTVYHYLRAYHFALWGFLFLGLFRRRRGETKGELFIASLVLFHLFSLATFLPSTIRFSVPVVAISLLWAGAGVLSLYGILRKRAFKEPLRWTAIALLAVIVAQLPEGLKPERRHREQQDEIGDWVKQVTPEGSRIMSRGPQVPFYAEREFVRLPPGTSNRRPRAPSPQEILALARERGVGYIVVNEKTNEFNPNFAEAIPMDGLIEVGRYVDEEREVTILYQVVH